MKYTPEYHVDHQGLAQADQKFQAILRFINEQRGINEDRTKAMNGLLGNIIFGENFHLYPSFNRTLIYHGTVLKSKPSLYNSHSIRFIVLLSDYILICKPVKKSEKLVLLDLVSLLNITISECKENDSKAALTPEKSAFNLIIGGSQKMVLISSSIEEQKLWIQQIKTATDLLIKSICNGGQQPPILRKHNKDTSNSFDAADIHQIDQKQLYYLPHNSQATHIENSNLESISQNEFRKSDTLLDECVSQLKDRTINEIETNMIESTMEKPREQPAVANISYSLCHPEVNAQENGHLYLDQTYLYSFVKTQSRQCAHE
ncbi:hypothetical protein HDV01_003564 [Terramyces sp. JEL0728]|nr:hypothetical protein HDV01_003564 [Terramyces sp. JEL0728]